MVFIDTFRARILVSRNIFMASTPNILLWQATADMQARDAVGLTLSQRSYPYTVVVYSIII